MRAELLDHLALIVQEEATDSAAPKTKISVLRKVTEEQAAAIQAAVKDLYFFTSGEDLYNCYQANMVELLDSVMEFAQLHFSNRQKMSDLLDEMSFSFSRLLLNLLAMFRSFLDHGSAALTRRFGIDSPEFRAWQAAQSAEYDGYVSYRFFSNLRNYAQHVGMPPLHFSVDQSTEREGIRIGLDFYRDELLSNYSKWSRHAREDLINGADKVFLLPLLDEWSHCFHRLVRSIQSIRSDAVMASVEKILSVRTEFKVGLGGSIAMMPEPKISEAGQLNLGIRYLPEHKAQEIAQGTFLNALKDY
ncbi:hypothetical protein ACF8SB_03445 [Pseudomonas sp. CJQ_8]|uniref:hypothetical protein n=1 Tax=Pseudomonas sp. CJQ_8 TaxID=3367167 RepID=UPI00370AD258